MIMQTAPRGEIREGFLNLNSTLLQRCQVLWKQCCQVLWKQRCQVLRTLTGWGNPTASQTCRR